MRPWSGPVLLPFLLVSLLYAGLSACCPASQRARVSPALQETRARRGNAEVTILSQTHFRGCIRDAAM
jgi:hypothetical protein